MQQEDRIEVDGTVVEVMPNSVYRIGLPNGHRMIAHVAGRLRLDLQRLYVGDRVKLSVSPFDLSHARIVGLAPGPETAAKIEKFG